MQRKAADLLRKKKQDIQSNISKAPADDLLGDMFIKLKQLNQEIGILLNQRKTLDLTEKQNSNKFFCFCFTSDDYFFYGHRN